MNKSIYILGAGGHTRSLINLLEYHNYEIAGIYDDSFDETEKELINNYPVLGKLDSIDNNAGIVLSFGENGKRRQLHKQFENQVLKENLIHPKAVIEKYFGFRASNQIFANVTINSNVAIGINNIINTGAILEHEVKIGDHNHISVGSIICGRVTIGNECFVGAGATIIDKLSICDNVIVGANSVVVKDIVKPGTYVGSPARRVK